MDGRGAGVGYLNEFPERFVVFWASYNDAPWSPTIRNVPLDGDPAVRPEHIGLGKSGIPAQVELESVSGD